jgi:hypothetical protein
MCSALSEPHFARQRNKTTKETQETEEYEKDDGVISHGAPSISTLRKTKHPGFRLRYMNTSTTVE